MSGFRARKKKKKKSQSKINRDKPLSKIGVLERHQKDLTMISNPDYREPVIGQDGVSYKTEGLFRCFHKRCFVCSVCTKKLDDGEDFFINEGKPFCHGCYKEKILGTCDKCHTLLSETG
ncbi:hypothetical protein BC829DRAFT_404750, partial [Chytridium lagenaria]